MKAIITTPFFYIPEPPAFSELIARFDWIQVVIDRNPVAIEPTDVCLADEVF
ncbi:MAG: hypothetical protein JRI90_12565 [Deltaproteobacteria bacterium]|nr:hypothetical protein [Deltaproteobacteria bacterium]